MKKVLLFLISLFTGIALFFWVIQFVGWDQIKNSLSLFSGWNGLIILILTILMLLIGTWKWKEILKAEGVNISLFSLFKPYLAGFSVMFLFPIATMTGEVFRGYILKKRDDIPWSKGMASVIIDRILEWTTNLVVIFFGLLFFLYKADIPPKNLILIFGTALLIFFIGIFLFYFRILRRKSFVNFILGSLGLKISDPENTFLKIEKELFDFFEFKRVFMWKALAISFLRALIMYARVIVLIFFLGEAVGALPSLSILGFSYLAAMIPIPTAIGTHEIIQTFAFNSFGLGVSAATGFAMVIRGVELIVALFGLLLLFRLGSSILRKIFLDKDRGFISDSKKLEKRENNVKII